MRALVEGLEFSISYTTRQPRGSEEDGREYYFVERRDFERMIAAGGFLEWAEVFGNYYGTAAAALSHAKHAGKDLLLDIDVQGAMQIMRKDLPGTVSIFIMPPTPEVLERRLRNRSEAERMTSEADLQRRLQEARKELDRLREYKYAIVNDNLDVAVSEMKAIVLAERGAQEADVALADSCLTRAGSARLMNALKSFGCVG